MARFYQTVDPTFIDYNFDVPTAYLQAQEASIKADDKRQQDVLDKKSMLLTEMEKYASVLEQERPDAMNIYKGFEDRISGVAEGKYFERGQDMIAMQEMENITRELQRELYSGNIRKMVSNNEKYTEWKSKYATPNAQGINIYNQDLAKAIEEKELNTFIEEGGSKAKTLQLPDLSPEIDLVPYAVNTILKELELTETETERLTNDPKYAYEIIQEKVKNGKLSEQRIYEAALNAWLSNENIKRNEKLKDTYLRDNKLYDVNEKPIDMGFQGHNVQFDKSGNIITHLDESHPFYNAMQSVLQLAHSNYSKTINTKTDQAKLLKEEQKKAAIQAAAKAEIEKISKLPDYDIAKRNVPLQNATFEEKVEQSKISIKEGNLKIQKLEYDIEIASTPAQKEKLIGEKIQVQIEVLNKETEINQFHHDFRDSEEFKMLSPEQQNAYKIFKNHDKEIEDIVRFDDKSFLKNDNSKRIALKDIIIQESIGVISDEYAKSNMNSILPNVLTIETDGQKQTFGYGDLYYMEEAMDKATKAEQTFYENWKVNNENLFNRIDYGVIVTTEPKITVEQTKVTTTTDSKSTSEKTKTNEVLINNPLLESFRAMMNSISSVKYDGKSYDNKQFLAEIGTDINTYKDKISTLNIYPGSKSGEVKAEITTTGENPKSYSVVFDAQQNKNIVQKLLNNKDEAVRKIAWMFDFPEVIAQKEIFEGSDFKKIVSADNEYFAPMIKAVGGNVVCTMPKMSTNTDNENTFESYYLYKPSENNRSVEKLKKVRDAYMTDAHDGNNTMNPKEYGFVEVPNEMMYLMAADKWYGNFKSGYPEKYSELVMTYIVNNYNQKAVNDAMTNKNEIDLIKALDPLNILGGDPNNLDAIDTAIIERITNVLMNQQ
jgi:hypothetical protein